MSMSKPESENDLLRMAYRDYWRGYREHTNSPDWPRNGQYPPVPEAIRGLSCGAKTRAGTPCKRIDLYWSGRCKFHGGLSTGPLTEVGKAKARENGKLGGRGHVRKPDPTETSRKPQGLAKLKNSENETPNGADKPNPMDTVWFWQGSCAVLLSNEPNPLETSQKLTFSNGEINSSAIPQRASAWREYCAERGLVLPNPHVPNPTLVVNTNRLHIIPAPSRRRR